MSTYSQTLTSYGEILANIPGILGFYPQNALILAFIVDDEGGRHPPPRVGRTVRSGRSRGKAHREPRPVPSVDQPPGTRRSHCLRDQR